MIIDQLPPLLVAGDDDEIAIEVGQNTYKIKKSDLLQEFMKKTGGAFTGNVSIGGTLGVTGDTDLGGDLDLTGNATVGGSLDVVSRRCAATLSSAGWYRVMQIDAGSSVRVEGGIGAIVNFNITRRQGQSTNEVHGITLDFVRYPALAFVNENSKSGTLLIDKIRYNTVGTVGYIDIHYTGTTAEEVAVCFDVNTLPSHSSSFTAETLQSVADAPTGETVLITYKFEDNLFINGFFRKVQSYDITVSANSYVNIDSFSNLGVSTSSYLISMTIRGFGGFSSYAVQLMKGTNGTDIYFGAGTAGRYQFSVEYWFMKG